MQQYYELMRKCFQLARLGEGKTSPNPLVGCVVLNIQGEIISTGFHAKYGENHAERDALLKIPKDAAKDGTLIVNLEPCSHYGKTPPCADLIIEYGIKKVVIAMRDVNPIVAGNGVQKLKNAGIEVVENVLENEARMLNEVFITNMLEKRVFVALKTATTLDGKVATKTGSSKWITSEKARAEVRNIRAKYDAILTSSSTVIADNPTMEHNQKVVLDRELKTDFSSSNIYKNGKIIVFYDEDLSNNIEKENIQFIKCPVIGNKLDISFVLKTLFELGIRSVLVESGGVLNGSFIDYTDKIYHFIAPKIIGDNSAKSAFDGKNILEISESKVFKFEDMKSFEPDILLTYTVKWF